MHMRPFSTHAFLALAATLALHPNAHATMRSPNPTGQPVTSDPFAPTSDANADTSTEQPPPEPFVEQIPGSEDEVVLRDGSFVRGRIAEITAGERVLIRPAAGGEARELAWADIDVIRRASGRAEATAPLPARPPLEPRLRRATPSPAEAPASPASSDVHVDFDLQKDRPVTLFEVVGEVDGSTASRAVCDSPCGRRLSIEPSTRYFVRGSLVTQSPRFTIPTRDRVTVRVKQGSWPLMMTGIVFATAGAILLSTGTALLAARIGRDSSVSGGVMLGVGLVLAIPAIPMILRGRTKVEVD